jgi:hypothetical protein
VVCILAPVALLPVTKKDPIPLDPLAPEIEAGLVPGAVVADRAPPLGLGVALVCVQGPAGGRRVRSSLLLGEDSCCSRNGCAGSRGRLLPVGTGGRHKPGCAYPPTLIRVHPLRPHTRYAIRTLNCAIMSVARHWSSVRARFARVNTQSPASSRCHHGRRSAGDTSCTLPYRTARTLILDGFWRSTCNQARYDLVIREVWTDSGGAPAIRRDTISSSEGS